VNRIRVLQCEWKIHFTILYAVPICILALLVFNVSDTAQNLYTSPNERELHLIFEAFWPLALALGFATVLPTERENGMLELRRSYPRSYALSLIQKLMLPLTIWLIAGLAAVWVIHNHFMAFTMGDFIVLSLPPALLLGGLTFLVSSLTLSTPISFLAASAWWGWELISQSKRSGLLALLPHTNRLECTASFLELNRYAISLTGLILTCLGVWLVYRKPLPTTEE